MLDRHGNGHQRFHDNVPHVTRAVLGPQHSTCAGANTAHRTSKLDNAARRDRPAAVRADRRAAFMGGTDGRPGGSWVGTSLRRWSMVGLGGSNSACGHAVRVDMGGSSVKTWVARVDTQCVDNSVTQLVARKASTRDNTSSASTWVGETAGASHPPRHGWVVAAASTCVGRNASETAASVWVVGCR